MLATDRDAGYLPETYLLKGSASLGGVRSKDGELRLIGSLGGTACDVHTDFCFGSPEFLHANPTYQQAGIDFGPLPFILPGYVDRNFSVVGGGRVMMNRDNRRDIKSVIVAGDVNVDVKSGKTRLNTILQSGVAIDGNNHGLYYRADSRLKYRVGEHLELGAGIEVSDIRYKNAKDSQTLASQREPSALDVTSTVSAGGAW
jgi:hypothetical protein